MLISTLTIPVQALHTPAPLLLSCILLLPPKLAVPAVAGTTYTVPGANGHHVMKCSVVKYVLVLCPEKRFNWQLRLENLSGTKSCIQVSWQLVSKTRMSGV